MKASTIQSMPTISRRWIGRRSATTARRKLSAHQASSRPPTPPRAESTRLSASSWRTSRARAGAERGSDRQLALTRRRAGQEQVGDVGAGDEEHERDRPGEHEQRRAHVAGQLFAKRHDPRRPAGVEVGKHPRQVGGDLRHVLLRARERDAGLQPADDLVERPRGVRVCAVNPIGSQTSTLLSRNEKPGGMTPTTVYGAP